MRESVGGAYLLYIAIFFISAVLIIFVSTLSYNKAFKAKNRIIEIIEEHGNFDISDSDDSTENEIINYLIESGYVISKNTFNCPSINGVNALDKSEKDKFEYCVYEYNSNGKKYYKVATYAYFKFPIINSAFKYTVYGETKLIG